MFHILRLEDTIRAIGWHNTLTRLYMISLHHAAKCVEDNDCEAEEVFKKLAEELKRLSDSSNIP